MQEELLLELEEARKAAEQEREQRLRTLAEQDNWRKRSERELEQRAREQARSLVMALLPVADNLERALAQPGADVDKLREGVEMVLRQFQDALARVGAERLEAEGEVFDPAMHEAMGVSGHDPARTGKVVAVLEPGYRMDGETLRPARVLVGGEPEG